MSVSALPFLLSAALLGAAAVAPNATADKPPARSAEVTLDTSSYTIKDVVRELPSLIVVTSSRPGYHGLDLDTAGAKGPLGTLARANWHYVHYLTDNAPSQPLAPEARRGFDLATVRQNVLRRLSADTVYLQALAQGIERSRALARSSMTSAPGATGAPRVVTARRVLDVAARFFWPDSVLPNGRIQAHVCVGINGIADMQGGRDLALEAFAYAAIFHDLRAPKFDSDADFRAAARLINEMDLSTDPATRLKRAQGVMLAFMLRSDKLHGALAAEYERANQYLPFQIAGALTDGVGAARR
jgi:hypothetical protein